MNKYYLTQRPAAPGAIPGNVAEVTNYPEPIQIDGISRHVYGFILTEKPLDNETMAAYELTPENGGESPREAELIADLMETFKSPCEIQARAKEDGHAGAREFITALCEDYRIDPGRTPAIMNRLVKAYKEEQRQ